MGDTGDAVVQPIYQTDISSQFEYFFSSSEKAMVGLEYLKSLYDTIWHVALER